MTQEIKQYINNMGQQAVQAAAELASADTQIKNAALLAIADHIEQQAAALKTENAKDMHCLLYTSPSPRDRG